MNDLIPVIVPAVVGLIAFVLGKMWSKLTDANYINNRKDLAEKESAEIVSKGKGEAVLAKKEALLSAKDEWYAEKEKIDDEILERKDEVRAKETEIKERLKEIRVSENSVADKEQGISARENFISTREKSISAKEQEISNTLQRQNEKLERIAHMSQDEAKKLLLENLENQIRHDNADMIKERRDEANEIADKEAREIVLQAIQRSAADTTVESTVAVVNLPNDDMKGRIIGREGRNIRTFEELTGIDVIVDDTPEAVILSSFDPVRREIGRMALQELVSDGRIHPGRIEEVIKKAEKEIGKKMKESVEEVLYDLDVHGIKPKILEMLGRLKYRTSYGQNVLQHSHEVGILAGLIASELGFDPKTAIRAGLLHDIGKAIDRETEGTHSEIGATMAKKYGENDIIINAIEAHHEDVAAISVYPVIVQAADSISSSRPGVRKETLSNYITRLTNLEKIADSFSGVNKSFVIQAGREMRIMVEPGVMTDAQSEELARNVATKIEAEMEYPGQIKVTTIREIRHTEYAK
jgi:ribonuclease Y